MSTIPGVRKLGFALQESVRLAMPKVFEADNSTTRDLQALQAFTLQLNIGLWGGDKRKMEVAEIFAQPVITMLRRAGRFRRPKLHSIAPHPSDDGETLETKWLAWVEAESFKRLAFHIFMHDAQASMSFLIRRWYHMRRLPLNCRSRGPYGCRRTRTTGKLFTWQSVLVNAFHIWLSVFTMLIQYWKSQGSVDLQMSMLIILYGIWTLTWEFRQLSSIAKVQSAEHRWNGALMSSSWHQELCQLLYHFRIHASEWENGLKPEANLILERSLMNLHVSFEDVQLFAGREGEEEARRAYPVLKQWAQTRESRQAVWHAGQVLKAATECHPKNLRDFPVIVLYHASLAFWAYAVVSRPPKSARKQQSSAPGPQPTASDTDLVWLDGEDGPCVQRFIALGRGNPVIRDWTKSSSIEQKKKYAALSDVKAVMNIIIAFLRQNGMSDERMSSPLVNNLSQLMRDLGNAALGIGRS